MERYSSRTIDDLARIVLPSEVRKNLGLQPGDNLSLAHVDTIVILHRNADASAPACAVCQVNDLGMIELPGEIRSKLGWKVKDRVALYHTDNVIILKLAEKE